MTLFGAIGWSLILFLCDQVCVGMTEAARSGAIDDVVSLTACRVLATSVVLFGIARVYAPTSSLRSALGIRPFAPIDAPLAALAGAGLAPLLATLEDAILRRWPYDPKTAEAMQTLVTRSPHLTFVIGAFVVLPIAQEVFYRGALFEQLLRTESAPLAVSATTVLFVLSALDPREMPEALAMGLVLGWIRAWSESVWPAVVAQLSFFAVYAVPIVAGRDPSADVVYPRGWIVGGAVVALLSLLAFAWRPQAATSS
jgi:membrane protease YdiL (CAAX protease family)